MTRVGAYVLPGDPVWLESSLRRYYDLLDDLVVPVPTDGLGWTGRPLPVQECLDLVAAVDTRGIRRVVPGRWTRPEAPMHADRDQRQEALDALRGRVDWVLQVDNDEVVPDPRRLLDLTVEADARGLRTVEWPMRTLFRRLASGRYLEVRAADGGLRFDYPGPVLARPEVTLVDARRAEGAFLRPVVVGDERSLQVARPAQDGEVRLSRLAEPDAIWHNSWARSPAQVWQKTRSWGHASGLRGPAYYAGVWYPARWTWRRLTDFHPFARGLWPRLAPVELPAGLVCPADLRP